MKRMYYFFYPNLLHKSDDLKKWWYSKKTRTNFFRFFPNRWSRFADEALLKMAQGWESIESKVFRQHSSSFIKAITDTTPVANKLHEESLIDQYTYNKVTEKATGLSQLEKATEVVKVLQRTVSVLMNDKKRQEIFEQILSTFSEFIPLRYIAEETREAYGKDTSLRTLILLDF